MDRTSPYALETVPAKRVALPRSLGLGVVVFDSLRVDVPLYRKGWEGLSRLSHDQRAEAVASTLEEAKTLAYEKFVLFLQIASEYEPFFPLERLKDHAERRYLILLPDACWTTLRFQATLPSAGRSSLRARYGDLEFELLAHPRLGEDEAYLFGRHKYTLYLHAEVQPEEVRVFRSDFLDTSVDAPPPIALRARPLLSELLHGNQAQVTARHAKNGGLQARRPICPQCAGRLVFLSPESAFCSDCDWDNLKILAETETKLRVI